MRAYLKLADEAAWLALRDAHLTTEIDGVQRPRPGVEIDEIGTIFHDTGATQTVGGITSPVMAAVPGYHANIIVAGEFPAALLPVCVNPARPKRVWAGSYVLAMPETLPEVGETLMVERGIGSTVPDDVLARIELAVLRGRLTGEQAEDRIALVEANIAIAEKRASIAQARQERDDAVAAVRTADAERDRLLALRVLEQAKRDAAIASLNGLTGAARIPFVAARDAAGAEITRLAALISVEVAAMTAGRANRDAAAAVLAAAAVEIAGLRAVRDGLKP